MYRKHFPFTVRDPDTGGGGGAGTGTGGAGTGGGDGAGGGDGFKPITTQADFDAAIQQRIARVKAEPPADYADLQAKAKQWDDHQAENQTASERTTAQITTLTGERDTANSERDSLKAQLADERKRNAVITAAGSGVDLKGDGVIQRATNPAHVWALLTDAQKNAVTIGDDGQVTGAEDAVKALITANPYLVGTSTQQRLKPDPAQGAGNGTGAKPSVAAGREMFEQSRKGSKASTTTTTT